ncbi:hypothetical protein R6Q59_001480 [Mikania micrantha]
MLNMILYHQNLAFKHDDSEERVLHWKRGELKAEDHIKVPQFPDGLSLEDYDDYFAEYISSVGMDPFISSRPLWEVHVFKYPTSNAQGTIIFKVHHALGDGYSLMGCCSFLHTKS